MDKEIVENYGWIVIILILALTVTLMSSPLGNYIYASMKMDTLEIAVEDKGVFAKNDKENKDDSLKVPIYYETNGGEWDGAHINFFISGKETFIPTNLSKENYTFAGWYTTNTFVEQVISIDGGQGYASTGVHLYAKWIGEEYTIRYNLAGGHFTDDTTVPFHYNYNTKINPPKPVREGYKFVRWDVNNSEFGTMLKTFDSNKLYTDTITFHAVWEKHLKCELLGTKEPSIY